MKRSYWIIGGVVLLVLALSVASFFATHKRVKKEVPQPPTGEARQNPYLALEEFLTDLGVEATTEQTASTPEKMTFVYLFVQRKRSFTPDQLDEWEQWVRDGGHLVLPAPPTEQERAPMLEAFGFHHPVTEDSEGSDDPTEPEDGSSEDAKDEEDAEEEPSEEDDDLPDARQYEVELEADPLVGWNSDASDWTAWDDAGERIATSVPAEKGRVTLIAGTQVLRNHKLDKGEHADFAWDVITLDALEGATKTAIVRFSTEKSWIGYAVSNTWPFLAGLAVLLILALNGGRWQFGPERPEPPSEQRSRVEHIRATGEFLWEHQAASRLLDSTRETLLERLAERRPSLSDASPMEARRIVREELDIEESDVQMIFDDRDHLSEQQFLTRIEAMERFRRSL